MVCVCVCEGGGSYLEEDRPDQRVHGRRAGRRGAAHALEAPEDEPPLAEDGEKVEHGGIGGAGP